ncbi:zinc transport system permease protein [Fluviicoccus keumensis]|uniref:Zinc transport system permease protein n=1 Tax=Fluviicoccus keumensis TaxID=1435465 RepID=A0A4Q7ZC41_9GAMM|nr:metal ABC transporter permease [Fluviicoccus keumensis]RZU47744.1 zinc transport system permease protein [Fluviicoccus keumensis]
MDQLLDPLFRIPLYTGLVASLLLPLLGALLHAREEWLAALGVAHVTAAAQLAGAALGLPLAASGALGAVVAVIAKQFVTQQGNLGYALLMFAGWAALYLVAANSTLGESLAHAMSEGQIFLVGKDQLIMLLAAGIPFLIALPWLAHRLLRARFFPGFEQANGLPAWRWHLSFDLIAAVLLAFGTASLGLMASFALVVLPAWSVFVWVHSWRWALAAAAVVGVCSYLGAFVLSLHYDQPFAPVQVAVLLAMAVLLRGGHALVHR